MVEDILANGWFLICREGLGEGPGCCADLYICDGGIAGLCCCEAVCAAVVGMFLLHSCLLSRMLANHLRNRINDGHGGAMIRCLLVVRCLFRVLMSWSQSDINISYDIYNEVVILVMSL